MQASSQISGRLVDNSEMPRPPANTTASLDDFRTSDWKRAACCSDEDTYFSRWNGLCTAAAAATQDGAYAKARILWLLGDACSLRLAPDKINEPLVATFEGSENSFSLSDFTESDIALLDDICPLVDDPLLLARIADILWLVRRPRKIQDALAAIDAYRDTPLAGDSWFLLGTQTCWQRAIMLALQIRAPGKSRLDDMAAALITAIEAQLEVGNAAPSMVETMLEYGLAKVHIRHIAEGLEVRATRLLASDAGSRFFAARRYLSIAKRCFGLERNYERCADIDCRISDAFVLEAESRISGEHRSYVVGASLYAEAVQALLAIPKHLRKAKGIDDKLKSLRQLQRDIAMQSLGDFAPMRGESLDLEEEIYSSEQEISGKEMAEALLALAECWPLASRKLTEVETRKRIGEFFFSRMFSSQKLATDGRVVAESPAASDLSAEDDEVTDAVWSKMIQDHVLRVRFGVQSAIAPALRQFARERLISTHDLVNIVGQSGAVPSERIGLMAKGLKAGFEGDFIVALHLLVPQIENFVRTHLKLKGAKTLTTEADSLQMEAGLSTLVALPEMDEVFGEDLAFEIRALFCEGFGPNLRNELAHGLLDAHAMQSAESIYAWWLIFRIVYQQYWYRNDR